MENNEEVKDDGLFETINAEQVKALYFNGSLIQPDYELFRLNTPRGRVYFRELGNSTFAFYGGTSNLTSEIPKDDLLIDWMANKGVAAAKRYFYLRMLFGSFEHSLLAELCIEGQVDLDDIPARVKRYFYEQAFFCMEKELEEMGIEAQKDMIAVERWIIDHEAKICFVELPVYSDIDSLATQIDIGAFIKLGSGSGKNRVYEECFSLVNFKSGKSGFHKEHKFQLEVEKNVFVHCYPQFTELPIRTFNLSGKKWRTTNWDNKTKPYMFTEQTDKVSQDRYIHYLELGKITRDERLAKPLNFIQGKMTLGDDPAQYVVSKTLRQIVEERIWERFVKSSASIPEK